MDTLIFRLLSCTTRSIFKSISMYFYLSFQFIRDYPPYPCLCLIILPNGCLSFVSGVLHLCFFVNLYASVSVPFMFLCFVQLFLSVKAGFYLFKALVYLPFTVTFPLFDFHSFVQQTTSFTTTLFYLSSLSYLFSSFHVLFKLFFLIFLSQKTVLLSSQISHFNIFDLLTVLCSQFFYLSPISHPSLNYRILSDKLFHYSSSKFTFINLYACAVNDT